MLIKILIGLAVVVVLILIIAALQPEEIRVSRSATMAAPPPIVFAQVNDFHKWEAWSPWAKLDPQMKTQYEGPDSGPGAKYSWLGNKQVGEGRMTIMESRPPEQIDIKLEFIKPFVSTNSAVFTLKPEGDKTNVTWTMICKRNLMFKAVGLFMSMDKMIGRDFEKGLAAMKAIAEAAPRQ